MNWFYFTFTEHKMLDCCLENCMFSNHISELLLVKHSVLFDTIDVSRRAPQHLSPRVEPSCRCSDVNSICSQPGPNHHFLAANIGSNADAVIKDHVVAQQTDTWGLFFHSAGSGSVQPFNQKAIRGGASGEDYPNLRLIPALNRSISSPLKVTSKTQEGEITKGTRRHLSDTPPSCLPDGQVSPDLLFWHHPGNIFLGFVLVVTLHANFNERLNKRQVQQLSFLLETILSQRTIKPFFF